MIAENEKIKLNLKKLVKEDPFFIRQLIVEINEEILLAKSEKLKSIIKEDFERYEEVFKALA
ncbi:MAG: hypothetical protein KA109_13780 [Saprospiraceae bacterium]|jgi:hypothetical protein|nr:hypothetical protein [Saprospiraceae bacterium]MBK6478239.1 hypothetical protein [Saprospiraceae bacterium]MBK6817591.1 hypothetical protein [Saprospiraceae bacterium]MBK7372977.1 hypothetical protein [Saprospiraceae bacterium]MBK7439703.1 hypothetical protein [Saprospiraceae bacterium]